MFVDRVNEPQHNHVATPILEGNNGVVFGFEKKVGDETQLVLGIKGTRDGTTPSSVIVTIQGCVNEGVTRLIGGVEEVWG